MELSTLRAALATATGIPWALYAWTQTPAGDAWGIVNETAEADAIWADDEQQEQAMRGYVSLFARTLGALPGQVQAVLNAQGVSWRLDAQDYEPDTKLLHYTWRWEDWR